MSRRRYISTDISLDRKVNQLATEHGDFAALLYTWMIPHAADNAIITADPDVLLALVIPRRRDKTEADIEAAINGIESVGLIAKKDGMLLFPPETFYKYQTYIKPDKRRSGKANAAKRRKTPQNTASLSLSPSLTRSRDKYVKGSVEGKESDPKAVELATLLHSLIAENYDRRGFAVPVSLRPDSWAKDLELLHRLDGFSYDEVEHVIRWCQADDFWSQNILSGAKLRKQMPQLILKAAPALKQEQGDEEYVDPSIAIQQYEYEPDKAVRMARFEADRARILAGGTA